MFGNKKRIEELDYELNNVADNAEREDRFLQNQINDLKDKLKALEDFLGIEYKEETTKGYVKKLSDFERFCINTVSGGGDVGRKSNNKKK